MGVHDVGVERANEARSEQRIDVARRFDADGRDAKRAVEVRRVPRRVVEADEERLDPPLGERGQQREQMALGAADPAHAVHVRDSHRARTRRMTASIVAAASSASRKSQATR